MYSHSASRHGHWSAPTGIPDRTTISQMFDRFRDFMAKAYHMFPRDIDTLMNIMMRVVTGIGFNDNDIIQIHDIVINKMFHVLKSRPSTDQPYIAFKNLVTIIDSIFRDSLHHPIPDILYVVVKHSRAAPSSPRRSPPRRAPSPPRRSPSPRRSPPRRAPSPSPPRASGSTDCRTLLRKNNINNQDDYKRFVLTHHPDKLVQAGASPARVQRGEAVFKRVVPCADEARQTYWR